MFELTELDKEIDELIEKFGDISANVERENLSAAIYATNGILEEQKRIIGGKYPHLTKHIEQKARDMSRLKANYEKSLIGSYIGIDIGYVDSDFRIHPELYLMEFGRPGNSVHTRRRRRSAQFPKRKERTVKLNNKKGARKVISYEGVNFEIDKLGRKIGKFPEISAIRRAWFDKRDEAVLKYHKYLIEVVKKEWGNGG